MALIDGVQRDLIPLALGPTASQTTPPSEEGGDFLSLVTGFLKQTNDAQHKADLSLARLAAGDPVELHQVMLDIQEATLLTQFTLQVRNKVIDAYQEIIRMPI